MELLVYGALIIVATIVLYCISVHNQFVRVGNKVEEALSGIDVALAKRYSVLTNLVEVVKEYVKYENEMLVKIVEVRKYGSMKDRVDANENYEEVTERLIALKEAYPDLKANEQFLSLQDAIQDNEEHLAASRRMYNSNVSIYNDLVLSFPSSLIGNWMGASKKEYFRASVDERNNVSIEL